MNMERIAKISAVINELTFLRYETLRVYGVYRVSLSTDHKLLSPWLPTPVA